MTNKVRRDKIAKFLIAFGIIMILCPVITRFVDNIIIKNKINNFEKDVVDISQKEDLDETTDEREPYTKTNRKLDELYQMMKRYNLNLNLNGQDIVDAFSYQDKSFDLTEYGFKENIIGVINIPKLKVKLPIYLGATAENLNKGAVHLSKTSLPLGETSSNVVIAAHRGLVKHQMFRHLDKLDIGDKITITTIWEELEYKVCDIEIISPTDSSKILIQEGKDMVTLITCHPFRVNTQRYVVYCERNIDK